MERQQLPENRREEGEKAAMAKDFLPVLRDQNQVRSMNGEGLSQRHLARPLSLHIFLLLILALVVLVLDETVPEEIFVGRRLRFSSQSIFFHRLLDNIYFEQLKNF